MKLAEKVKKIKPRMGFVTVKHKTDLDPDGDPIIIQIKEDQLPHYEQSGYFIFKGESAKAPEGAKKIEPPVIDPPADPKE